MKKIFVILVTLSVLASCGTKKAAVGDGGKGTVVAGQSETDSKQLKLNYMRRVYDNAVYIRRILSPTSTFRSTQGRKTYRWVVRCTCGKTT